MISHKGRVRRRRFSEALRRSSSALAAICFILAVCCAVTAIFPGTIKAAIPKAGFHNRKTSPVDADLISDNADSESSALPKRDSTLETSESEPESELHVPISDAENKESQSSASSLLFVTGIISRLSSTGKAKAPAVTLGLAAPETLKFKNCTSYDIDPAKILSEFGGIEVNSNEPQILIIHTHATEAYSQTDGLTYTESDPYRTTDNEHNMVRVGGELEAVLNDRGIMTLHDETLFDYPNYNNSYSRSMEAIENWLKNYPSLKIVLDVHRDAIEYSDGTIYRTSAEINNEDCAQILIISGTDNSGLYHPGWRQNLGFGFTLEARMDEVYPGLTRPLKISQYRYNMHATPGSLLIEVGSHGNTLTEALAAVKYFGNALADVLLNKNDAG